MFSLKKQLIGWSIGLLAVIGVCAGSFSYFQAQKVASIFLDHQLRLVAGSVDEGSQLPAMQAKFLTANKDEQKNGFVIQVSLARELAHSSRPDFDLPLARFTGYSDVLFGGETWRAYTIVYADRTVQVSQSDLVRSEIANDAALSSVLPIAVLFPLSWILVVFGAGRILKPLEDVTQAVTLRDAASLSPLAIRSMPTEVAPLITEINGLFERIHQSIESQRHFVLDAAHELRNPLAALQLQIESLTHSHSPDDLDIRVQALRAGILRASHIVSQLLKLARLDAKVERMKYQFDLSELTKSCLSSFIPVAENRHIDLGMLCEQPAMILASKDELRTLFDNLLDNAIRYTQCGGQIDVSVEVAGEKAIVTIMDNGPGIPEALLSRVFDRFFRVGNDKTEGSGIGLAIVNSIAARESAELKLANRQDTHGLIAMVSFNLLKANFVIEHFEL